MFFLLSFFYPSVQSTHIYIYIYIKKLKKEKKKRKKKITEVIDLKGNILIVWNYAWDAKFSRELCMGMPNSLFGGGYQKH